MMKICINRGKIIILNCLIFGIVTGAVNTVIAEEVIKKTASVPGLTIEQVHTYKPNKEEFDQAVQDRLGRMHDGDYSAFQSPAREPTLTIQTETSVFIGIKGFGYGGGKFYERQYFASEHALEEFLEGIEWP